MHVFPFPANSHLYLYRISRVLRAAEVRRGAVAPRCVVLLETVTGGEMSPVVISGLSSQTIIWCQFVTYREKKTLSGRL